MDSDKTHMSPDTARELVISQEPIADHTIIWRYLKFERFIDTLMTHSLWFSRPVAFDDQWEGLFPPSYVRRTQEYADANGIPFEEFDQEFRKRRLWHRYAHFVNCWHISIDDSDAMWRLYALPKRGIAIQSTVGDVRECLAPHNSGKVNYYDPAHDVISRTIFGPHDILFKRKTFSWEEEYRFWFDDENLADQIDAGLEFRKEDLSTGRRVRISDLKRLVKRIVVAPGASDEFMDLVRSVCSKCRRRWLGNLIERSYSDRMWDSFTKLEPKSTR